MGAVLDAARQVGIVPAAESAQRVQRAIAEQAVKILRPVRFVAGEKFTFLVLKKAAVRLIHALSFPAH